MKREVVIGIAFFVLGIVFASAIYANIFLFSMPVKNMQSSFEDDFRPVTRSVPVVAVNSYDGQGVVGKLNVKLIPGNSNVLIDTNPFLETDIQYSANVAVAVAKLKANVFKNVDYVFSYDINSEVVGGGSAGAATAIAVIAALEGKNIRPDVAITGTINPDGSIGRVGGVLEKAKAVAEAGYKVFLIPKGQSRIRYYEKVTTPDSFFGFAFLNSYYVPRYVDLREVAKNWGLKVVEVGTIDEAMDYMLE